MSEQIKLIKKENKLSLIDLSEPKMKPIAVDFGSGAIDYRRKHGGGLRQHIAKAIGVKGNYKPYIIDATAGLGRDSFVLASLGCKILMLERNKIIFKLLEDGLKRGKENKEISEIIKRMKLLNIDSIKYLKALQIKSDVIYIDPMFPHSKKSRLVKKEMRFLRKLAGNDLDAEKLLVIALEKAKKRVVVKRPAKAEFLGNLKPDFQTKGRVNRFDIYLKGSNG